MLTKVKSYLNDFSHLFYPHNCLGCGTDILEHDNLICTKCSYELPETGFFSQTNNLIEKKFIGRINVEAAGSAFYFTKDSLLQKLLFELKYRGNKEAGTFLGKLTGLQMLNSQRFQKIDVIVPLPLNAKRQMQRGYNQAEIIANNLGEILQRPVLNNAVIRKIFTETQTHKGRISRWQNMEGVFLVDNKDELEGKHILLIDDVVTTGATLEACGEVILHIDGTKLSVATVAFTI
jgi:ComF family protein